MKRLALILFLPLLCSCRGNVAAVDTEIRDTVLAYNRLLAEGYRDLNMNPVARVATERRLGRLYHHMASLGEAGVRMEMAAEEIAIAGFEERDEGAEVTTRERWRCEYFDIGSGAKLSGNTVRYGVSYRLVRNEGRWLVDDLTVLEAVESNPLGGLPFLRRPVEGAER
ncbi:MAG: hypothetical protein AB1568_07610 [Thermodesulfobacteriota bacterium]